MEVLTEVLKNLSFGAIRLQNSLIFWTKIFSRKERKVPKDIPTDKVLAEDSPMNPENLNFDF